MEVNKHYQKKENLGVVRICTFYELLLAIFIGACNKYIASFMTII